MSGSLNAFTLNAAPLNADASGAVSLSFTMSGGAVGSGSAAVKYDANWEASGGGVGSGAADVSAGFSFDPAVSAIGSGAASTTMGMHFDGSGGGLSSGAADITGAWTFTPVGGAVGSGAASVAQGFTYAPSGGAIGSSAASVSMGLNFVPNPLGLGGGSGQVNYTTTYDPAGIALGGGASSEFMGLNFDPSGGALSSGDVIPSTGRIFEVDGGNALGGGDAEFFVSHVYDTQGGAVGEPGYDATIELHYFPAAMGLGSGSAALDFTLTFIPDGGAIGGGSAEFCSGLDSEIPTTLTLADIILEVRQLIGDYQAVMFKDEQITHEIFMAQADLSRRKGFNVQSIMMPVGVYPSGYIPPEWLTVKRVELVIPGCRDSEDVVIGILRESTMEFEDAQNERWRNPTNKLPSRYVLTGNQQIAAVPIGPTNSGLSIRVYYIQGVLDYLDPRVPDYYYDVLRYGAAARLMMLDTDLKSVELSKEYQAMFMSHIASGVEKLAVAEVDQ